MRSSFPPSDVRLSRQTSSTEWAPAPLTGKKNNRLENVHHSSRRASHERDEISMLDGARAGNNWLRGETDDVRSAAAALRRRVVIKGPRCSRPSRCRAATIPCTPTIVCPICRQQTYRESTYGEMFRFHVSF